MDISDSKGVVRRGYDRLSEAYDQAFGGAGKYGPWIEELLDGLPAAASVLDVGCGTGVPVARSLHAAGHRVLGIDISEVQVRAARAAVPGAAFVQADVTTLEFPPETFDAVVGLYSLIHIPVAEQRGLLAAIGRWLRPGGRLLCVTGHEAWTGADENWLDTGVTMWWSHADAATSRSWIREAGLDVVAEDLVPEGGTGHVLFWARRPARRAPLGAGWGPVGA